MKDVKEGVIVLALETSHDPNESTRTEGWTKARTSEKQEEKKEEKQEQAKEEVEEQAKEEEKKGTDNDDANEEDATEKKDDSDNKAEKDDNKEESDGDEDGDKLRRLRRRRQLKSADQSPSQSDRILLPDQFKYVQLLFHRYRCHQSPFTSSLTYLLPFILLASLQI